jgi:hypothetical protein
MNTKDEATGHVRMSAPPLPIVAAPPEKDRENRAIAQLANGRDAGSLRRARACRCDNQFDYAFF